MVYEGLGERARALQWYEEAFGERLDSPRPSARQYSNRTALQGASAENGLAPIGSLVLERNFRVYPLPLARVYPQATDSQRKFPLKTGVAAKTVAVTVAARNEAKIVQRKVWK
jgi:hypothetical protein